MDVEDFLAKYGTRSASLILQYAAARLNDPLLREVAGDLEAVLCKAADNALKRITTGDLSEWPDEGRCQAALEVITQNAVIIPDPNMQGSTDIYAVPLDDIDAAKLLLRELNKAALVSAR